ncbi:hypothetical protein chiPu_0018584 [Chiloscyllium punctatum]|uniref:VWFD domain-containing protein n=1 Tax=Chiloscyllium punctatum TaxID=137246 RepID=A0A401RNZ9_CHIPU|nr:hypothetical protein [Chiloscyllium punctatum]
MVNTPILFDDKLEIRISGRYVSLETDFGLRVRYDGNHHVDVTVPSSYEGELCGLCGPFRECNTHIPPESYFEDCVYDMSCGTGDMASLCFTLASYATLCAKAGFPVSWRNQTFCPLNCPANSHYEPCASACPASCTDLSAPNDCSGPCVEDCVCDVRHILSGDQCVPFTQCGCVDPDRNYRLEWAISGRKFERLQLAHGATVPCGGGTCTLQDPCDRLDPRVTCPEARGTDYFALPTIHQLCDSPQTS